jgi:hypothetical protein
VRQPKPTVVEVVLVASPRLLQSLNEANIFSIENISSCGDGILEYATETGISSFLISQSWLSQQLSRLSLPVDLMRTISMKKKTKRRYLLDDTASNRDTPKYNMESNS